MVKLMVAARVVPEDEYLESLTASSPIKALRSEKRLLVTVREPYKWQIGTLALEIKRAYKSCYQRDLTTIKYLKDNEDDCDLDPQLYVSDLLLDEGKAERDGSDQKATIKVILEQGRAVREGSVAVGNLLENPQFHIQHQKTSRPPVPKFPGLPSALGKRQHSSTDAPSWALNGSKRQRQVDIPGTHREESLVSTIERDPHGDHRDHVVPATQSPPQQSNSSQHVLHKIKAESPELWGHWQNVTAATADELQELDEEPTGFLPPPRHSSTRPNHYANQFQQSNGEARLAGQHDAPHSRLPVTPVVEPSRHHSSSGGENLLAHNFVAQSTPQRHSSSAGKFKRPARKDIYDYPESDIDDSQMSPRSKSASLHRDKSRDRFTRIESLKSPPLDIDADQELTISQAVAVLDNESVFNDNDIVEHDFRRQERNPSGFKHVTADNSSDDIFEDAETNADNERNLGDHTTAEPFLAENIQEAQHSKDVATQDQHPGASIENAANGTTIKETDSKSKAKHKKRKRPSKSGSSSVNDDASVIGSKDHKVQVQASKPSVAPFSNNKDVQTRSTPIPDNLDEQLSQSLQQSAHKSLHKSKPGKTALTEPSLSSSKKKTSNKKSNDKSSEIASPQSSRKRAKSVSAENKKSEGKPAKRERMKRTSGTKIDLPSSNFVRVDRPTETSSSTKSLPNRGSTETSVQETEKSPSTRKQHALTVDEGHSVRTSPSIPIGLTEEELKILKSREGMTKQEYEAEKRRKQLEQKQADAAKKRESLGKSTTTKTKATAAPLKDQVVVGSASDSKKPKSESQKHTSVSDDAKSSRANKSATESETVNMKATDDSKKHGSSKAGAVSTPKTVDASSNKKASVKSSSTSQNRSPEKGALSTQPSSKGRQTPTPAPAGLLAASQSRSTISKPKVTEIATPTIQQARSLKNLHAALKTAHEIGASSATSSRNSSRPNQKKFVLNTLNNDSDDDESSDEESDVEVPVQTKAAVRQISKPPVDNTKVRQTDVKVPASRITQSLDSTSSSGNDSDEDSVERQQTEAAKQKKSAEARATPASQSAFAISTPRSVISNTFHAKRPDPTIRDASIEVSDDSSDDDESDAL